MPCRYSKEFLHRIRNEIDIRHVVQALALPWKISDGYFRFLCPQCSEFNTATHPRTNLGRCFRCRRNFNPIDIVMAVRASSFLESVEFLAQRFPTPGTDSAGPPDIGDDRSENFHPPTTRSRS
jgi:DNA primase